MIKLRGQIYATYKQKGSVNGTSFYNNDKGFAYAVPSRGC